MVAHEGHLRAPRSYSPLSYSKGSLIGPPDQEDSAVSYGFLNKSNG